MVTERQQELLQLLDLLAENQLVFVQLFPAPCSAVAELGTWLGTLLPSTAQDETVVSPKNIQ